jgi:thioredoxin-related protein
MLLKKIILYILVVLTGKMAYAQADTSLLYIKYPDVPPFTVTKVPDSSKFTKADLQKKKAVMIMIFSPDCDHCQHEVKEILEKIELFKDAQILLVSHLDYHYIKTFYEEYNVASYPGITIGWDPSYFLGTFYNTRFLPAIFLYNKKGKFLKAFDGSVPVEKIVSAMN